MQDISLSPRERASRQAALGRRAGLRRKTKAGFWKRHHWLRQASTAVLVVVLLGSVAAGVGMIVLASFQVGLPSVASLPYLGPPQDSQLLASDGSLLADLHEPGVHHVAVGLSQVSRWLSKATIAVEDRHFYQDTGAADLPRILESGIKDLVSHRAVQGASTITEQLAKNSFLTPEKTITRKIRELLLGYEIAKLFPPKQILQMYINRINYGNQAIGIGSAAQLYFHVPASKLDLAQASMLAGIPDAPTAYNPLLYQGVTGSANFAKDRQQVVLQAMVRNGYITDAQAAAALKEPLTFYPWQDSETVQDPNFVSFAEGQLQAKFGDAYLNPGGWTIYTSLNPTDQSLAVGTMQNPSYDAYLLQDFNIGDASLLSLDPRNGEILAMVGTTNPAGQWGQINMTDEPRQPGSSFKMFTYTAAIASGKFTMTTPVLDAPIDITQAGAPPYSPANYDHRFHGICQVQSCLGNSINVAAVKVELMTGLQNVVNTAERMGVSDLLDPANTYGVALTLGGLGYGITMVQMATGASVLASGGVLHQPTTILRVTSGKRTLYQYNVADNSVQVIPSDVAFIMNAILSNDKNRLAEFGSNSHLTLPGRPVSAKTGTSNGISANGGIDQEGIGDNWTFGWTPQMLTATWVGNPDNHVLSAVSSGITGAAPLWQTYMEAALQGQPVLWYAKPADLYQGGSGATPEYYLPNTLTNAHQNVNCPGAYRSGWNGIC
ncbi:MAG: transglycosylase domain-containing protein [Candidatus Dormibacteria bacterium]